MDNTAKAKNPDVSVIVAANRFEDLLPQTIESVLQQSFSNWELLIVGSGKDASIKAMAQKDLRIRLVPRPQDALQGTEFSLGLEAARGDYVTFLQSGDLYLSDFLEKLYGHSQLLDHVDLAFSDFRYAGKRIATRINYTDAWSWRHLRRKKLNRKKKHQVRYIQFEHSKSCIRHRSQQEAWSKAISFYLLHGLSSHSCRKLYRREFLQGLTLPKAQLGELPLHWISCMQATNLLFCNTIACQPQIEPKPRPRPKLKAAASNRASASAEASGTESREAPAILLQFGHMLDYLVEHLAQQDAREGSGPEQNFYLLLCMRSLLATFCFGSGAQLDLQSLQDWQDFFQATQSMLHHKLTQSKVLAKTLKPTYRLKFSDSWHLRLNLVEQIAWNLLLSAAAKPQAQCGKFTICFLAFLYCPAANYWLALRARVRLLVAKLLF